MRVTYIEVSGFRSFGAGPQRLDITSPLVVIHAENSQGKTTLVEAFEFLLTGATSRRQLGGGSPQEYSRALRHVHLPADATVYVEAGFKARDQEVVVRRELVQDYEGAGELVSSLTVDGAKASGLSIVGVALAEPPIAAPVLLEHALRYAVSAKPADRSAFFRAIIEATDLDEVRTTIDSVLAARKNRPQAPILGTLSSVQSIPQFGSLLSKIKTPNSEQVAGELKAALRAVVPIDPSDAEPDSFNRAMGDVERELTRRQQGVFPVNDLAPTRTEPPRLRLSDHPVEYEDAVSSVDKTVADLLPVFHAALRTDLISGASHPVDCPVCQTPGALTPERIQAIREEVAARDGLTKTQQTVAGELRSIRQQLAQLNSWLGTALPRSADWTAGQDDHARQTLSSLGASLDSYENCRDKVESVRSLASKVESARARADSIAFQAEGRAKGMTPLSTLWDDLQVAVGSANQAAGALAAELQTIGACAESVVQQVKPLLAETSSTHGWQDLLDLCSAPGSLAAALAIVEREQKAEARLRSAQRAIVAATRTVLDQRLAAMAAEIRKWWSLLRPDELTTFGDLTRRGTGNKMLDLTAALIPEPEVDGEVRNALAVLSNSQMNALGLATFIARCRLLASDVIFLDDPVPGSDPEHRMGFADSVLKELLDSGVQVIIATHDPDLARSIETIHAHRQPDEFGVAILAPTDGSRFERRGDDFEHSMLEAKSQMSSPLTANRRAAGNALRTAAERLAKHIIVAGRIQGGETAALSDYDMKNLGTLTPIVTKYVVMPEEPGYWTNLGKLLNPANHDAPPPQSADLKHCYEWLRIIKKRHGVNTAAAT
jgi:predicted ATPase